MRKARRDRKHRNTQAAKLRAAGYLQAIYRGRTARQQTVFLTHAKDFRLLYVKSLSRLLPHDVAQECLMMIAKEDFQQNQQPSNHRLRSCMNMILHLLHDYNAADAIVLLEFLSVIVQIMRRSSQECYDVVSLSSLLCVLPRRRDCNENDYEHLQQEQYRQGSLRIKSMIVKLCSDVMMMLSSPLEFKTQALAFMVNLLSIPYYHQHQEHQDEEYMQLLRLLPRVQLNRLLHQLASFCMDDTDRIYAQKQKYMETLFSHVPTVIHHLMCVHHHQLQHEQEIGMLSDHIYILSYLVRPTRAQPYISSFRNFDNDKDRILTQLQPYSSSNNNINNNKVLAYIYSLLMKLSSSSCTSDTDFRLIQHACVVILHLYPHNEMRQIIFQCPLFVRHCLWPFTSKLRRAKEEAFVCVHVMLTMFMEMEDTMAYERILPAVKNVLMDYYIGSNDEDVDVDMEIDEDEMQVDGLPSAAAAHSKSNISTSKSQLTRIVTMHHLIQLYNYLWSRASASIGKMSSSSSNSYPPHASMSNVKSKSETNSIDAAQELQQKFYMNELPPSKFGIAFTSTPQAVPFQKRYELFHQREHQYHQDAAVIGTHHPHPQQQSQIFGRQTFPSSLFVSEQSNGLNSSSSISEINIGGSSNTKKVINRQNVFQSALSQISIQDLSASRLPLKIEFQDEVGVDGGGLYREFLQLIAYEIIVTSGLFDHPSSSSSSTGGDDNHEFWFGSDNVTRARTYTYEYYIQYIQKHSDLEESVLNQKYTMYLYEFAGAILAKALQSNVLLESAGYLNLPVYKWLLHQPLGLHDFASLDRTTYHHLISYKKRLDSAHLTMDHHHPKENDYDGSTSSSLSVLEDELAALDLVFTCPYKGRDVPMIANGQNVSVNTSNLVSYVHSYANIRLNGEYKSEMKSFRQGFESVIREESLSVFSPNELRKLMGGDAHIDLPSLEACMTYSGGFHRSQPIIGWFWEILLQELTYEQQTLFLKFMTSCTRKPLMGYKSMVPLPCIQQIPLVSSSPTYVSSSTAAVAIPLDNDDTFSSIGGSNEMARSGIGGISSSSSIDARRNELDEKRMSLPKSGTCFNLLKLPPYPSKRILKEKLVKAIEADAGFDLT